MTDESHLTQQKLQHDLDVAQPKGTEAKGHALGQGDNKALVTDVWALKDMSPTLRHQLLEQVNPNKIRASLSGDFVITGSENNDEKHTQSPYAIAQEGAIVIADKYSAVVAEAGSTVHAMPGSEVTAEAGSTVFAHERNQSDGAAIVHVKRGADVRASDGSVLDNGHVVADPEDLHTMASDQVGTIYGLFQKNDEPYLKGLEFGIKNELYGQSPSDAGQWGKMARDFGIVITMEQRISADPALLKRLSDMKAECERLNRAEIVKKKTSK